MDAADFGALFDSFTDTVFRLETLQYYDVSAEDEDFRAWRERAPLPEYSVRTSSWLARIAATTITAGKQWSRAHLIRHPLTDYLDWEIRGYLEQQAVGEQILLVDLDQHPELSDVGPDFWLFDERTDHPGAVLMRYDEAGRMASRELAVEPATIQELAEIKARVLGAAVPLNTYLAGRRVA